MYISVFTDELKKEVTSVLPIYAEWGMKYVDFRGLVNGMPIEKQSEKQLKELKAQLDDLGLKTGVIQSSLCKVHLPDAERQKSEMEKLDGIIRASEILDCKLVRSFNFWQHKMDDSDLGALAVRPDELSKVLEMFYPFAQKAKEAGLVFSFENCGQTPDEVITFLEALNVPEWGMAWDVSNMFEILPEAQGDCTDYFTKALKYANMVHVKSRGVPALPELEYKKVPWDRVLRGVMASGKDMPVSIETHLPAEAKTLMNEQEATERCYQYIKKVWPESAPGDMKEALSETNAFERPYKDDPVRMVVVGLGKGKGRCGEIEKISGIKLVGVCDINEEKAKATGEQFGVPYSTDIHVFLNNPDVEAVYVVTPTGTHCKIAQQCLKAGKHVLVTKPMDVNHEICEQTKKLAQEKGLLFACDFDMHFRGPLTELRDAVKDNYFGKVKSANIILNILRTEKYFEANGHWRGTWALDGGGALSNQGIHELDRIITLFGMPQKVRCTTYTQTHDIEVEDLGICEMLYENGMIDRLSSTTSYPASTWYTRIEVFGDKGAYLSTAGGPEGNHIYWWQAGAWSEQSPYPFKKEWAIAADNFANAIRTGEPLVVTADNGIQSRYLLDKCYQSAENDGSWVEV